MNRARIFYFVYDLNTPSGGEKHSYQHVDVLNASGFEAYALHSQRGVRHTWFENQTRVIDLASCWDLYDRERDYVVVPEVFGAATNLLPGRRVIFNKNLHYGYKALGLMRLPMHPYAHPKVAGIFAVSEHNLKHLRFAFPNAPLFRMYAHIDCDLFAFRPLPEKKRRIVFTRKAPEDLACLFHTLAARAAAGLNNLGDYEWVFLEGKSEQETARLLSESAMFVTLSTQEGLPRTVLEAMACGCLVIAYGSGPLAECLPEEYRLERDDFIAAAERIESMARAFPDGLRAWTPAIAKGRKIAESYTRAQQQQHLVAAWEQILSTSRA
jgi:glycosyltransferase involved in cell wall biosynthesis